MIEIKFDTSYITLSKTNLDIIDKSFVLEFNSSE